MKKKHIPILKSFDDLRFNLGKKSLVDFVKGDLNPTIERNNLDELNSYGCLFMNTRDEILYIIEELIKNDFLKIKVVNGQFKVVQRTSLGLKEIYKSKFEIDKKNIKQKECDLFAQTKIFQKTEITKEDEKIFAIFDFFLKKYNREQKKAITSNKKNILCIAGAGSGKTTVLTKRIEFLKKFKDVKEKKILAITFTRKAKEEMSSRINTFSEGKIKIETFNSFCEKLLKKYNKEIYKDKKVRVANFGDKIAIVKRAILDVGIRFEMFFDDYFNKLQVKQKTPDELFFVFVNDVFSILDYYKNLKSDIKPFFEKEKNFQKKRIAKTIYEIVNKTDSLMRLKNLRDFSDQMTHVVDFFKSNPKFIPKYDHILVDEFQDANERQVELLQLLNPDNIFAVGDPRQAIYGWRGSKIEYILNFSDIFKNAQIIQLEKNYRSQSKIVNFFNSSIKSFGLIDLKSGLKDDLKSSSKTKNNIFIFEQDNELLEKRFVLEAIKNSKNERNEIFVIARTNRILEGFSRFFSQNKIAYTIKSEEEYKNGDLKEEEVVLATVHSIKGMEAKEVYLVGCNNNSFPNKVQDNFVFALVKEDNDYDKGSEELRLFYVALSRAKEKLIITYTGNYSKFINDEMIQIAEFKRKNKNLFEFANKFSSNSNLDKSNIDCMKSLLKDWRMEKADETRLPLYMIISNKAIDDICSILPRNKSQMKDVSGMGSFKIAKYGDDILRILNGK